MTLFISEVTESKWVKNMDEITLVILMKTQCQRTYRQTLEKFVLSLFTLIYKNKRGKFIFKFFDIYYKT